MRRLFLILAILGAMVAGWTPAMAASMHAAATATEHTGHQMAQSDDHSDHGKQKHGSVHPLLCSACFAVMAEALSVSPSRSPFAAPVTMDVTMIGGDVRPIEPPPRDRTY